MLKVRTLFSGIGAFEKALTRLGVEYEVVDFCEIDKFAVKSYCAIHGISEDKNLGDITKVWGRNLPYADLLTWGFPCQDISVAGNMKGMKEGETRSGLYYEGFRILKETMPKYSIIENVKNLVGKKFKADFEKMLSDIESLGYNNYWKVLNAKDYGIPQNRERVFIISVRKDIATGFEFPKGFDNGVRLKDLLEKEVDEKYYIAQDKVDKLIMQLKDREILEGFNGSVGNVNPSGHGMNGNVYYGELAPTLTTNKGEDPKILQVGMLDIKGNEQVRRVYSDKGLSPTLNTMEGGNRQPKVLLSCIVASRGRNPENPNSRIAGEPTEQRLEINKDGNCNTLTSVQKDNYVLVREATKKGYAEATFGDSINIQFPDSKTRRGRVGKGVAQTLETSCNQGTLTYNYRIRKLIPLETFRLMGFDDADFERASKVNSNSQLYKECGNSIVVNVLEEIFKNLL